MDTELLKTYKQLEGMNQTEEVIQIKNQIKESLYQQLRYHFLELSGIGRVIVMMNFKMNSQKQLNYLKLKNREVNNAP